MIRDFVGDLELQTPELTWDLYLQTQDLISDTGLQFWDLTRGMDLKTRNLPCNLDLETWHSTLETWLQLYDLYTVKVHKASLAMKYAKEFWQQLPVKSALKKFVMLPVCVVRVSLCCMIIRDWTAI